MANQTYSSDSWWNERQTKPASLNTSYHAPLDLGAVRMNDDSVWAKAGLTVGLMFSLVVSIVSLAAR